MARTWRDYACDNSDNTDKSPESGPHTAPIVPTVPIVTGLPDAIREGLSSLASGPAPRVVNPQFWPAVVADALRLASDGWAQQALRLEWTPLDVFGAVIDPHGDPAADGLAVKLNGRPIVAISARFATVRDRPGAWSYIYRGSNDGARLLWEIGRSIR